MTSSTQTQPLYRRRLLASTIVTLILLTSSLCLAASTPPESYENATRDDTSSARASEVSFDPLAEGLRGSALAIALARAQGRGRDIQEDALAASDLFRVIDEQIERQAIADGQHKIDAARTDTSTRPTVDNKILLQQVGGFGQIVIQRNAWIVAPDGKHPGVSVTFYRTVPGETPLVTRAVFPVIGQTFAVHDRKAGRTYASRPRLGLSNVVVEVLSAGSWQRIEPSTRHTKRSRRPVFRDVCDATCSPNLTDPFAATSPTTAWP